jgi:uncharacterized glyoxalase superfamily protein PhnB
VGPQISTHHNQRTPMTDTIAVRDPAIQLKAAVPTFLVADVSSTAHWYADKLGFRTAGTVPTGEPYVYASLQRDGVELMLLRLAGYQKPDLTSRRPEGVWDAYVRMEGVHAFYETVRGQPFIRTPLRKQPYGDWEFEVRDPNGYILVFSELTD